MTRNRRRGGFTMIELIIAIALAVGMISAVYTATRSMADSARRQQASSAREAHWDSVVEIIQRDLRGWLPTKQAPARISSPSSAETVLVEFTTTSDSIGGDLESMRPRAVASIKYIARKVLDRYELVRSERDTELILRRANVPPKLDFYNGKVWLEKWTVGERPAAVRFTSEDAKSLVVKL